MKKELELFIDGASHGNPGPAAVGIVVMQEGEVVKNISKAIGEATNNVAEYTALIYALQEALIQKATGVLVNTDSELLYHQLEGNYKVKNANLKPLHERIVHLKKGFEHFYIRHVPREQNKGADMLAAQALFKKAGQGGYPERISPGRKVRAPEDNASR